MTLGTHRKKNRTKNWRTSRSDYHYGENRFFDRIEKCFYYYKDIKKAIETLREEEGFYKSNSGYDNVGGRGSFISDPTADSAIHRSDKIPKIVLNSGTCNEEEIRHPEDWVFVVEQTLEFFKNEPQVREVLIRRYLLNEPQPTTCIDLEINTHATYYKLRDVGLRYARECAIQIGILKAF